MKYIALVFLISSCAAVPAVPNSNNCGMRVISDADDFFAPATMKTEDLDSRMNALFSVLGFVTDPEMFDIQEQCQKLVGYRVYTKKKSYWQLQGTGKVGGATWCYNKTIHIATPVDGDWKNSSMVHEMFHVLQNCKQTGDDKDEQDRYHNNWDQYGIWNAIEMAREY